MPDPSSPEPVQSVVLPPNEDPNHEPGVTGGQPV